MLDDVQKLRDAGYEVEWVTETPDEAPDHDTFIARVTGHDQDRLLRNDDADTVTELLDIATGQGATT